MTTLAEFNNFVNLVNERKAGIYNLNHRVYAIVPTDLKVIPFVRLESAPLEVHDLKSSFSIFNRLVELDSLHHGGQELTLEVKGIEYWVQLRNGRLYFQAQDLPPMVNDVKQGFNMNPKEFVEQFLLQPGNRILINESEAYQDAFLFDFDKGQWIHILSTKVWTALLTFKKDLMANILGLYNATNMVVPDLSLCEVNRINQEVRAAGDLPPELSSMIADKLTL